ncbi:ArsR/SmtB family transcription factor [Salinibacter altiplanensis]|uniref:ArsR/SmtB family transcription factor n=1 Tax=Salinibacter altiplanensis TaxID=1803181 RepID=UPI000C9F5262|nr:metalloregulator ArsR/SmtB family transcription factor [Salinibacter altiplanensis]
MGSDLSETVLSEAFKALGNPHRLALMQRLLACSLPCSKADRPEDCEMDPTWSSFGELAEMLDVGKATVSRHLKELRRAGLVERTREGRRVYVRANVDRIEELRQFLDTRVRTS